MEQKAQITLAVKTRLISLQLIAPWVIERPSHSSIFNIPGNKSLYHKLQKNKIHCALRGNGIRISFHYYNQMRELDTLIDVLESNDR